MSWSLFVTVWIACSAGAVAILLIVGRRYDLERHFTWPFLALCVVGGPVTVAFCAAAAIRGAWQYLASLDIW